jgi:hypothetical protein
VPRSNRPRRGGRRPAGRDDEALADRDRLLTGVARRETHVDGVWLVRTVSGAGTTKTYRCPGCDQEVVPGTAHVVVWRDEPVVAFAGIADRRHWHTPCWAARGRRGPRR